MSTTLTLEVQPEFYYRWGSEDRGYVSTGTYIDDVFVSTGQMPLEKAERLALYFHNPHS